VLAITTAVMLAHTPAHATAAQTVHGFTTGVYVTAATAGLLVLLALGGLLAERRRKSTSSRAQVGTARGNAIDLDCLERAA